MQAEPKLTINVRSMRGLISRLNKNQRMVLTRAFKPGRPNCSKISQGPLAYLIYWIEKRFHIRITPMCAFQLRNYYRGYWAAKQGD